MHAGRSYCDYGDFRSAGVCACKLAERVVTRICEN